VLCDHFSAKKKESKWLIHNCIVKLIEIYQAKKVERDINAIRDGYFSLKELEYQHNKNVL
jgi:N-acetylneuraminic acid mutarotase